MPKALVTGGAGFIGSHVVERFLRAGYEVEVIDDLSTGKRENLPERIALHVEDVASSNTATILREGNFDVVAHLAAQVDVRRSVSDPVRDATTNLLGTINLLEAIRASRLRERTRVVFASTGGALYGDAMELPTEEHAAKNPVSPYGIGKLAAEYYAAFYGNVIGLDTCVVRFGNVYGPRQDPLGEGGVVAIFSRALLVNEPLKIYGTGHQTRDYIYVGDVAEAIHVAATRPLPASGKLDDRAFNIGTGVETSVLELARALGQVASVEPTIQYFPMRLGEIDRSLLGVRKAQRELGWCSSVPLPDGLAKTVAWLATVYTSNAQPTSL